MYRVTIECEGVAPAVGADGARDIEQEFRKHRIWHQRPSCSFSGGVLRLVVDNDFDSNGTATLDEFADSIVAYIGEHGRLRVASVETV